MHVDAGRTKLTLAFGMRHATTPLAGRGHFPPISPVAARAVRPGCQASCTHAIIVGSLCSSVHAEKSWYGVLTSQITTCNGLILYY